MQKYISLIWVRRIH